MPESEDTGGRCREGHQKQDCVLQSKYDGGVGPRFGMLLRHIEMFFALTMPS